MSRQSIVGQIYGYGVSLLAVLIILVTIHGIVNNIFRVINPAADTGARVMFMHRFGGPDMRGPGVEDPGMGMMPGQGNMMWGFRRHDRMFGKGPSTGASAAPTIATAPGGTMQAGSEMGSPMGPMATARANMAGLGRFNAIRMLIIDIVMLIVGILLFRWHWDWLHGAA